MCRHFAGIPIGKPGAVVLPGSTELPPETLSKNCTPILPKSSAMEQGKDFRKDGEMSAQPTPGERSSVSRQGKRLEVRKHSDKLQVFYDQTSAVKSGTVVVTLFDPSGRVVRQRVVSRGTAGSSVSLERPSHGMYILQLSDGLGRITRRKIGL